MMTDEEIQKTIASTPDIREACKTLIARANESGGEDNITAVLIKIEEVPDPVDGDTEERLSAAKSQPPTGDEPTFAEEPTMPGVIPDVAPKKDAAERTPTVKDTLPSGALKPEKG